MDFSLRNSAIFVVCSILLVQRHCSVGARVEFYPHGLFSDDSILEYSTAQDEPRYQTVNLTKNARFYGVLHKNITIGSDGVIAFGSQSPSYSSVPEPFPASGRPILAPFWTEANYQNAGKVYYRVTNTSSLLQRAGEDISQAYSRVGVTRTVSQTELVIVTWKDLRSTADANLGNTFQCVIAISSASMYVFFMYDEDMMNWVGSSPALVGFNAGDGTSSFALPTSLTDGVLEVSATGNTGSAGKWIFQVDGNEVQMPGVIIGWAQTQITAQENANLELCASLFGGILSQEETVELTYSTGTTKGDGRDDYNSRFTRELDFDPSSNDTSPCRNLPIKGDSYHEEDEVFYISLEGSTSVAILPRTITVTIMDDDSVFVNYVSITILEEVGSAIIRAQLVDVTTGQSGCLIEKDVQVSYDTFPGDAVEGVDYHRASGTITIDAPACSANARVTIIDDLIFEESERIHYTLSSDDTAVRVNATLPFADIIITDDDGRLVTIGMVQESYTAREGETFTGVCAQMTSGSIAWPLTVTLQSAYHEGLIKKNLATDDVDLDTVNTQLIFLPGMSNQMLCINVTTFTDGIYEGPEARGVSLINTKVELNPEKSILEIVDVDGVTVSLERSHYDYKEGQTSGGLLPICANLTGEIERDLVIGVHFRPGSATSFNYVTDREGDVKVLPDDFGITFNVPPEEGTKRCNSMPCTACSDLEIVNDNVVEEKFEDFTLSLSHDDLGGAVALTSASIVVIIEDDDTAKISVDSYNFTLGEDSTDVPTMAVTRSGMSDIATVVRIVPLRGISATGDEDFEANDNQIVIPPSNTEEHVTASGRVGVTILDDLVVERDETFELQVVTPDAGRLIVEDTRTPIIATITDNDNVLASYTNSSFSVSEGEGLVDVCVQMTGFAAVPLTITVSTQPGTALVGIDFLPQSIPILLPPTEQGLLDAMYNLSVSERLHSPLPVSPPVCTNVSIIDDDILELVETKSFHLSLSHDSGVFFTAPSTATVTITDNDNVTVLVDEASRNTSAIEGQDAHICARMLGRADFVISGSFQTLVVPDSAQEGMDFVASLQNIMFPATSAEPQCVNIPTVDDSIVEGREEFKAELAIDEADNAKIILGAQSTATIAIEDDDFVEVTFEALDYSIVESEGEVVVCAVLTGRRDVPVSVSFSVRDPPAQDQGDLDYITIPSIPLFEGVSTESSQRECVNISISNDTILEDTEYFDVVLNSSDSSVRVIQGESRVYIIDDDGVRVGLTERALTVSEGDGQSSRVCVELVGRIQGDIQVILETQANSAQAGADYTAILTTLVFTTSERVEQEICIDASIVDDSIFENDESFKILLLVDHSAVSVHIGETMVTILDDDHVTLTLAASQTTLPEDIGEWELCVVLAGQTERDVSYQLDITALEAVRGADFLFTTTLSSFSPTTSTSQCYQVTILDDLVLEDTEHLEAELTAPGGVARVSVGTSVVRAAIIDDDSVMVGFSQTDFTVDEDEPQALSVSVCVEMVGELEREVSVSVASERGSADGADFVAVREEFTFSPRPNLQRRQCFNVHVLEDRVVEESETFFLVLSSSSLGVELEPSRALFTITDNDVVCLASSLDTSRGYFKWEETFPGSSAEIKCENGSSIRVCSILGEWEKPITSDCYVSTNELFRYVEKHGFTEDNLEELLFAVLQLLQEGEEPGTRYVQIIDQIFQEFLAEMKADASKVNTEMFTVLLEIINAIQSWPQDTLQDSSPSIVSSLEEMSQGLFDVDGFTSLTTHLHSLSYLSKKAQISELFPQDKTALQYLFTRNEEGDIVILNENTDSDSDYETSITLPSSILEHFTGGQDIGLVLTYYDSAILFPFELNATQKEMEEMESVDIAHSITPVVAATFTGQDLRNLKDNVIITFTLELDSQPNVTCVSWDFGANGGRGNWVEDGCELISFEDGEAVCGCSHLTNYACLLEHTISGPEALVMNTLSLLSIIGVSISLLGLVFTILTLLVFGKLRKRTNSKFRLQLCVAMILMLVFFVTGIYQTETFEICVLASALLHYFTLVTAMWMFADALLMLLKLTLVISDPSTCFIVLVSLLCWSLPIPAVVVPIGIDRGFSISDEYCFISNTIVFFAALLGPIGAVLCLSLVIFLVAICTIIAYSTKHYRDTKKASKRRGACRSIFSNLGVMFLFGLTWVFGAFTIRGGPDYFKYLFVGFNSLQGLFVFIFFVVLAKETQSLWLQTCGCKQRKKRKSMISAITGVVPPKPQRMGLDANADRLRAMEEMDQDMRLGMTSWDIMFVVPQGQQTIPADTTPARPVTADSKQEQVKRTSSMKDLESNLESTLMLNLESNPVTREASSLDLNLESKTLHHGSSMLSQDTSIPSHESTGRSPTHSLDSTQNAYECMSTADSGILMDKMKNSPTPPPQDELQHPQSGSTSRHIHSVSGIGYISADSSMETLPQGEEDCYCVERRSEPIKLAPSLRPRAILNEYTRVDVDNHV